MQALMIKESLLVSNKLASRVRVTTENDYAEKPYKTALISLQDIKNRSNQMYIITAANCKNLMYLFPAEMTTLPGSSDGSKQWSSHNKLKLVINNNTAQYKAINTHL